MRLAGEKGFEQLGGRRRSAEASPRYRRAEGRDIPAWPDRSRELRKTACWRRPGEQVAHNFSQRLQTEHAARQYRHPSVARAPGDSVALPRPLPAGSARTPEQLVEKFGSP